MNKKHIIYAALAVLLAVILLLLAFCDGKQKEEVTTPDPLPTETTTPAPEEPEWEIGYSRAKYAEAIYTTLTKGTEVEVVGQYKDYYVIAGEPYDLLVEKRFVGIEGEEAFESKTGRTNTSTQVFDSVYRRLEPITELTAGTEVTVLAGKGNWMYIEWADGKGYVRATSISYVDNSGNTSTGGGNVSNSGTSTPIDGTDVDVNTLAYGTQAQHGLVMLGSYHGPQLEEEFEKTDGVILADDVEAYICLFEYNEELKVLEYDDKYCTIYLEEGLTAKLPRGLVRLAGDEAYESWDGYSTSGTVTFEEYQLRNAWASLELNTQIKVLDKLPGFSYGDEGVYVVSYDGDVVYMGLWGVSQEKQEKPADQGGNSGNANGGDSPSTPTVPGDTWTPPVL